MRRAASPILLIILAAVAVVGTIFVLKYESERGAAQQNPSPQPSNGAYGSDEIKNFDDCAAAGNPVMESYPRQCRTPDGKLFVEVISQPPVPPENGSGAGDCAPAGCSGQLCVDAKDAPNTVTTCEYRQEYVCYKNAECERQADGKCGWTQTSDLKACLEQNPSTPAPVQ